MPRPADTNLLGTYATPAFNYGDVVTCELHGEVTLVGLREAPIPWPVGKKKGRRVRSLVLYADLAEAVKRESAATVMHWWGVRHHTVWKWRQALGSAPPPRGPAGSGNRANTCPGSWLPAAWPCPAPRVPPRGGSPGRRSRQGRLVGVTWG